MADQATFISVLVPKTMEAGRRYDIIVRVKNTGKTTWRGRDGYKLAVTNPRYTKRWKTTEVPLGRGEEIAPDRRKVFRFKVTAPRRAGVYNFQWQMKRTRSWFPKPTTNLKIKVR